MGELQRVSGDKGRWHCQKESMQRPKQVKDRGVAEKLAWESTSHRAPPEDVSKGMGSLHYFSHGDLYMLWLPVFLRGQKGISAGIRLVGKLEINSLVSFHYLSSPNYPGANPPCPQHAHVIAFLLPFPISLQVPEQSCLCPIDWAGFQLIVKLTVLPLHQNNKLSCKPYPWIECDISHWMLSGPAQSSCDRSVGSIRRCGFW